jgi:hypothetical protein
MLYVCDSGCTMTNLYFVNSIFSTTHRMFWNCNFLERMCLIKSILGTFCQIYYITLFQQEQLVCKQILNSVHTTETSMWLYSLTCLTSWNWGASAFYNFPSEKQTTFMLKTMFYSTSGTVSVSIILCNFHSFCYRTNKIYSLEFKLSPSSVCCMFSLYVFFWVISRHLNFICRRFGTLCHRQVGE